MWMSRTIYLYMGVWVRMLAYTHVCACMGVRIRMCTCTHAPKNMSPKENKQERKVYKERNK